MIILPLSTETLKERLEARDLTEQLAATLSRMRVAAVTLAHPSGRFTTNAPQLRNAGMQYCLVGRLMQRGERTRVVVRLIDVAADQHLWGDSFDGSLDDPFALRDRVVDCVLSNVVATVTDTEIGRACDKDPAAATARDLAMRALPLIMDTTVPETRKAIVILTHAIEFDPTNALVVALLAACHAHLAFRYGTTSPAQARAKATATLGARRGSRPGRPFGDRRTRRDRVLDAAAGRSGCIRGPGGRAGSHQRLGMGTSRHGAAFQRRRSRACHRRLQSGTKAAGTVIVADQLPHWDRGRTLRGRPDD